MEVMSLLAVGIASALPWLMGLRWLSFIATAVAIYALVLVASAVFIFLFFPLRVMLKPPDPVSSEVLTLDLRKIDSLPTKPKRQ
jgi:hypothetical protein